MSKDEEQIFDLIHIFASKYGWTIEYIQKLSMYEINGLLAAINRENEAQQKEMDSSTGKRTFQEEQSSKGMEELIKAGIAKPIHKKKKQRKKKREKKE